MRLQNINNMSGPISLKIDGFLSYNDAMHLNELIDFWKPMRILWNGCCAVW